jgi:hypothetical protein
MPSGIAGQKTIVFARQFPARPNLDTYSDLEFVLLAHRKIAFIVDTGGQRAIQALEKQEISAFVTLFVVE